MPQTLYAVFSFRKQPAAGQKLIPLIAKKATLQPRVDYLNLLTCSMKKKDIRVIVIAVPGENRFIAKSRCTLSLSDYACSKRDANSNKIINLA